MFFNIGESFTFSSYFWLFSDNVLNFKWHNNREIISKNKNYFTALKIILKNMEVICGPVLFRLQYIHTSQIHCNRQKGKGNFSGLVSFVRQIVQLTDTEKPPIH